MGYKKENMILSSEDRKQQTEDRRLETIKNKLRMRAGPDLRRQSKSSTVRGYV